MISAADIEQGLKTVDLQRLGASEVATFLQYFTLLRDWNERLNLTRVPEEEYVSRHLLDSLVGLHEIPAAAHTIYDIGSGAGCPGIPLAVALPTTRFVLIESQRKKAEFLSMVVQQLCLSNVRILNERAEIAGRAVEYREQADVVVARAVAELAELAELALPLVKVGGRLIAWKSELEQSSEEVSEAAEMIALVGGGQVEVVGVSVPGAGGGAVERTLVVVQKMVQTPERFPRANRSGRRG